MMVIMEGHEIPFHERKLSWHTIYHAIWWNIMIYQGVKCISSAIGGSGVHFCGLRCGFSHWGTLLPGGSCPWWLHSGFTKKKLLSCCKCPLFIGHTVRPKKYMTMLLPSHLALSRPARTHRTKYLNNSSSNWSLFDSTGQIIRFFSPPFFTQGSSKWPYLIIFGIHKRNKLLFNLLLSCLSNPILQLVLSFDWRIWELKSLLLINSVLQLKKARYTLQILTCQLSRNSCLWLIEILCKLSLADKGFLYTDHFYLFRKYSWRYKLHTKILDSSNAQSSDYRFYQVFFPLLLVNVFVM